MSQESRDSGSSPTPPAASLCDPEQVPSPLWALAPAPYREGFIQARPSQPLLSTWIFLPHREVPGPGRWEIVPGFCHCAGCGEVSPGQVKLSLPSGALCTEEPSTPGQRLSCSF